MDSSSVKKNKKKIAISPTRLSPQTMQCVTAVPRLLSGPVAAPTPHPFPPGVEMEQWKVPVVNVVGDFEDVEEDAGGVLVRRRTPRREGANFGEQEDHGNEGKEEEGHGGVAEEKREGEEHRRSVYFDEDEGKWKCHHCSWTYQVSGTCVNHFENLEVYCHEVIDVKTSPQLDSLNNSHVKVSRLPSESVGKINGAYETKHIEVHPSVASQSEIKVLTSIVSSSEAFHPNGKKVHDYGVEGQHEDEPMPRNRWASTEIDVEKVLEEQDTHDLYCPNCNSCITKRVILHKRKRKARENHFDTKREKIEPVRINIVATDANESPEEQSDQEPYIFKCLSCFSYFIMLAEGGFTLFKGFWRKDCVNQNLQTSQPASSQSPSGPSSLSKSENVGEQDEGNIGEAKCTSTDGKQAEFQTRTVEKVESKRIVVISPVLGTTTNGKPQSSIIPGDQPVTEVEITVEDHKEHVAEEITTDELKEHAESAGVDLMSPLPCPEASNEAVAITPLLERTQKPVTKVAPLLEPQNDLALPVPTQPSSVHVVDMPDTSTQGGRTRDWDVLKAIVYGGLVESVTSLGVISSAAGSNTSTLNIIALGLANLIGGLFLLFNNLSELPKEEHDDTDSTNEDDTYARSLGKRGYFVLHATVALISYIIFGMLPPVVYGFSFWKSDNKEYKLIAVAATSLLCIAALALAKAYVQREPKPYFKYLFTYIALGVSASGISYVLGVLIEKCLESLPAFNHGNLVRTSPPSADFLELNTGNVGWSSH